MDILSQLSINKTLFIQLINFAILTFILSKFLFKPLAKIMEERKNIAIETEKNNIKATKILEKSNEKANKIIENGKKKAEMIMEETKKDSMEYVKAEKDKAKKEAMEIIKSAREKAMKLEEESSQNIEDKIRKASIETLKKITQKDVDIDKDIIDNVLKSI